MHRELTHKTGYNINHFKPLINNEIHAINNVVKIVTINDENETYYVPVPQHLTFETRDHSLEEFAIVERLGEGATGMVFSYRNHNNEFLAVKVGFDATMLNHEISLGLTNSINAMEERVAPVEERVAKGLSASASDVAPAPDVAPVPDVAPAPDVALASNIALVPSSAEEAAAASGTESVSSPIADGEALPEVPKIPADQASIKATGEQYVKASPASAEQDVLDSSDSDGEETIAQFMRNAASPKVPAVPAVPAVPEGASTVTESDSAESPDKILEKCLDEEFAVPVTPISSSTTYVEKHELEEQRIRESVRKSQRIAELKKCVIEAAKAVAIPVVGYGMYAHADLLPQVPQSIQTGLGSSLGIGAALSMSNPGDLPLLTAMKAPYSYLLSKCGLANPSKRDMFQKYHNELEEEFKVREATYSVDVRKTLSQELKKLQENINKLNPNGDSNFGDYKYRCKETISKLRALFQQPLHPFPVNASAARAKMEKALSTYDKSVRDEFMKMITRISMGASSDYKSKVAYYLVGDPGVGKTTLVQELANALDLPLMKFNMDSSTSLLGQEEKEQQERGDRVQSSQDIPTILPGKIAQCLAKKGPNGKPGTNPIILLDEAHDAVVKGSPLYSELKLLTEPNQRGVRDEVLDADLDVSKATIILIGNEEIAEDSKGALKDRLVTIKFPPVTQAVKMEVGRRYFEEKAKYYSYAPQSEDSPAIEAIIRKDEGAGVRGIQKAIDDYLLGKVTPK